MQKPIMSIIVLLCLFAMSSYNEAHSEENMLMKSYDSRYQSIRLLPEHRLLFIATQTTHYAMGTRTTILNLAKAGEICKVLGHNWIPGCGTPGCAVFHSRQTRHCIICNTIDSFIPGKWESEKE